MGVGECSLLNHLSIDYLPDYEATIRYVCQHINSGRNKLYDELNHFPSIKFGLETAFADLDNGGKRCVFSSSFYSEGAGIPINGLIWMGGIPYMKKQLKEKIDEGFSCIKIKIGSLDFSDELAFLNYARKEYGCELEIRLDANGAFAPAGALEKLKKLSEFNIHSIEQPVKKGQIELMAELCAASPIPIALDEELIGVFGSNQAVLLQKIKPHYIILKPSLLGGFSATDNWIDSANSLSIGWWITSALEANIGLNAIAQYAFIKGVSMPQGLGTGSLYRNNIPSPLEVRNDKLYYNSQNFWKIQSILHV